MEIVEPARVEVRPERPTIGIRIVTPFRGMLAVRDRLLAEMTTWIGASEIEPVGYGYLRLHVIDMSGAMDLEVGHFTEQPCEGDGRVQPGSMPAGHYATLTYKDHSMRANRALIEWARANGVAFDRADVPEGDRFACRYEAYLTDPKLEPRKTKRAVELAFKVVS